MEAAINDASQRGGETPAIEIALIRSTNADERMKNNPVIAKGIKKTRPTQRIPTMIAPDTRIRNQLGTAPSALPFSPIFPPCDLVQHSCVADIRNRTLFPHRCFLELQHPRICSPYSAAGHSGFRRQGRASGRRRTPRPQALPFIHFKLYRCGDLFTFATAINRVECSQKDSQRAGTHVIISRRRFSIGIAAFGLTACGGGAVSVSNGPSAKALPPDLGGARGYSAGEVVSRKGTTGVKTNGVTANFMCFLTEGLFGYSR